MSVNLVSRFHSYRVHPVSHSDSSPSRDDQLPRHTPKKEWRPTRRRSTVLKKRGEDQPSMVGVFLDRWA